VKRKFHARFLGGCGRVNRPHLPGRRDTANIMEIASTIVSVTALTVSVTTAWLTLLRRGAIRMTQPTLVFFGPDGGKGGPKVFLRTLLYSTAKRGQIVENMFIKLRRRESLQTFNVWVYGDGPLARGSGIFVGENGVACNHHFLLPKDGTDFRWLQGDYEVAVYASLVGRRRPRLLSRICLKLTEQQATAMEGARAGVFFDWGPDSANYHAHLDDRPKLPALLTASNDDT
jgi:hypothetical protein